MLLTDSVVMEIQHTSNDISFLPLLTEGFMISHVPLASLTKQNATYL